MKIKIVEPYYLNRRYDVRSLTPSVGPVAIGTLLRNAGHEVEVISEYVSKLNVEELNQADIIGISLTTYNATRGFQIARSVKKPVVFGGFHASLMPEECLRYGDYVIRGDGHPVVDLADFIEGGVKGNVREIANLVYRQNGQVVYNREESKAINVVPDFRLVKGYFKLNLNRLLRIPLLVNASRGCNYHCTFCCIREVYKDVKQRDKQVFVKSLISQIRPSSFLLRLFPRVAWITDDNFFADKAWAKSVLKDMAKTKTGYQLVLQARPDIAEDEELLDLLKQAGVTRVYLGIESLSQKSLDNLGKEASTESIEDALKKIRNYGIEIFGLFVFGDDEFKIGSGKKVANFAKKQKLSGVLIQPLTPFPGTKLFQKMKKEKRLLHENWHDYNGKVVFIPKHLTPAELQKEIYDCYRAVYSPSRILKALFFGKRGFRLGLFGEGLFRRLEAMKSRNYIRECLRGRRNKSTYASLS
jgi:radical SAM superfamily enzyme YgiQ (UPF0313 family)